MILTVSYAAHQLILTQRRKLVSGAEAHRWSPSCSCGEWVRTYAIEKRRAEVMWQIHRNEMLRVQARTTKEI